MKGDLNKPNIYDILALLILHKLLRKGNEYSFDMNMVIALSDWVLDIQTNANRKLRFPLIVLPLPVMRMTSHYDTFVSEKIASNKSA